MNAKRHIAVLALGIGFCLSGLAQAPASAPAGSTGVCNDGSFSTAASKSGACRGHKGVKAWYSAVDSAKPKAGKTSAASSAATPAPAAVTSPAAASAASTQTFLSCSEGLHEQHCSSTRRRSWIGLG